jgi:hypothetical protein
MTNRQIHPSGTLRGRRGSALLVGALLLGLGATGCAGLAGGAGSEPTASGGNVTLSPASPSGSTSPARPTVTARPSPTAAPTADPNALADGVYPTYVRAVDVTGATITVDVLQTFFGADAHQAAVEDGVPWSDVRYDPVYIRNENPLLRTLRVATDAKIDLIGVCMDPGSRVGLTKLREATTPFTDTFYYDVSVVGGAVERIRQLVAVAAC